MVCGGFVSKSAPGTTSLRAAASDGPHVFTGPDYGLPACSVRSAVDRSVATGGYSFSARVLQPLGPHQNAGTSQALGWALAARQGAADRFQAPCPWLAQPGQELAATARVAATKSQWVGRWECRYGHPVRFPARRLCQLPRIHWIQPILAAADGSSAPPADAGQKNCASRQSAGL